MTLCLPLLRLRNFCFFDSHRRIAEVTRWSFGISRPKPRSGERMQPTASAVGGSPINQNKPRRGERKFRRGRNATCRPERTTNRPKKFSTKINPLHVTHNLYSKFETSQIGTMHDQAPKPTAPTQPVEESQEGLVAPWIPESKLPPLPKDSINSIVRNILLTNPLFPIFYADVVIDSAPNSNEAKILARNYEKIKSRISMANTQTCTHIHVTGTRCGSPTLRGESFCYFHQHAHRGVRRPPHSRLHPVALIENQDAIQASLMEIINALLRNNIDVKRAELILRALHIAVKNTVRHTPLASKKEMIREIPTYAEPAITNVEPATPDGDDAEPEPELDIPYTAAIPPEPNRESIARDRIAAKAQAERDRQAAIRASLARAAETIATDWKRPQHTAPRVVTASSAVASGGPDAACPERSRRVRPGPAVSGRGANTEAAAKSSTQDRKPPISVQEAAIPKDAMTAEKVAPAAAPKERKNAAHRASGG